MSKLYRYTNRGAIVYPHRHERWVSNFAKKRYAYPTKESAWLSFLKRKKRQLAILRSGVRELEILFDSFDSFDENIPSGEYHESVAVPHLDRDFFETQKITVEFFDMDAPFDEWVLKPAK